MNEFTRHGAGKFSSKQGLHQQAWKAEQARLKKATTTVGSDLLHYQYPNMGYINVKVVGKYEAIKRDLQERSRSPSPSSKGGKSRGNSRPTSAKSTNTNRSRPTSAGSRQIGSKQFGSRAGSRPTSANSNKRGRSVGPTGGHGQQGGNGKQLWVPAGERKQTNQRTKSAAAGSGTGGGQARHISPEQMDRIMGSMSSMLGSLKNLKNVDAHSRAKIANRIMRIRDKFHNLVVAEKLEKEKADGGVVPEEGKSRPTSAMSTGSGSPGKHQQKGAGKGQGHQQSHQQSRSPHSHSSSHQHTPKHSSPKSNQKMLGLTPTETLLPDLVDLGSVDTRDAGSMSKALMKSYSRSELEQMENRLRSNSEHMRQKADFLRNLLSGGATGGDVTGSREMSGSGRGQQQQGGKGVSRKGSGKMGSQQQVQQSQVVEQHIQQGLTDGKYGKAAQVALEDATALVVESAIEQGFVNRKNAVQNGNDARREWAKSELQRRRDEEAEIVAKREKMVKDLRKEIGMDDEEEVDIPDDEETNAAATKLQAIQRGKKARQEVEEKKKSRKVTVVEEEEEEVDIPDDEETNAAATKLQAIHRGKTARAEVEQKKQSRKAPAPPEPSDEEEVDIPDDEETNAAATKLQAIQRGKKARQEVEQKKQSRKPTAPEPEDDEEEIDIPDDEETNAAATKLQAIQRGKNARRDIEQKKANSKGSDGTSPGSPDKEFVIADFLVNVDNPAAAIENDFLSRTQDSNSGGAGFTTPATRTKPLSSTDTPSHSKSGAVTPDKKKEIVYNPYVTVVFQEKNYENGDALAKGVVEYVENGTGNGVMEKLNFVRVRTDDSGAEVSREDVFDGKGFIIEPFLSAAEHHLKTQTSIEASVENIDNPSESEMVEYIIRRVSPLLFEAVYVQSFSESGEARSSSPGRRMRIPLRLDEPALPLDDTQPNDNDNSTPMPSVNSSPARSPKRNKKAKKSDLFLQEASIPNGSDVNLWKRGNRKDRVLLMKCSADGEWLTEMELATKKKRVRKAKLKAATKFIGLGALLGKPSKAKEGEHEAVDEGIEQQHQDLVSAALEAVEGVHQAAGDDDDDDDDDEQPMKLEEAEEPTKTQTTEADDAKKAAAARAANKVGRFDRFIQNLTLLPDSPPDRVSVFAMRGDEALIFSLTAPGRGVSSKKIVAQLEMKLKRYKYWLKGKEVLNAESSSAEKTAEEVEMEFDLFG